MTADSDGAVTVKMYKSWDNFSSGLFFFNELKISTSCHFHALIDDYVVIQQKCFTLSSQSLWYGQAALEASKAGWGDLSSIQASPGPQVQEKKTKKKNICKQWMLIAN